MGTDKHGRTTELCVVCRKQGRFKMAEECDHIVPKAKADANGMVRSVTGDLIHFNDKKNLQPLCNTCHEAKTIADSGRPTPRQVGLDGYPI